jgi:hypothetical protein
MSKAPSKQLGAILNRVPSATAPVREEAAVLPARPASLSYGTKPAIQPEAPLPPSPPAQVQQPAQSIRDEGREVPLQVLIPLRVRIQLDQMHVETRKPLRRLVLESLKHFGLEVTEDDLAGKRGQRKTV